MDGCVLASLSLIPPVLPSYSEELEENGNHPGQGDTLTCSRTNGLRSVSSVSQGASLSGQQSPRFPEASVKWWGTGSLKTNLISFSHQLGR